MTIVMDIVIAVFALLAISLIIGPRIRDGRMGPEVLAYAISLVVALALVLVWVTGQIHGPWYIYLPAAIFALLVVFFSVRLRGGQLFNSIVRRGRR